MQRTVLAWTVALVMMLGAVGVPASADTTDARAQRWSVSLGFMNDGVLTPTFTTADEVQVNYDAAGLPRGSRVLFQRQTGKTWQTVKKLAKGRDITFTLGRLPMGRAVYRVHVLDRNGGYFASSSLPIAVFGRVSLNALREANFRDSPNSSGEVVIDGNPHPVSFYAHDADIVLQVRRTTCNLFALGVGIEYPGNDGATDTGFVVQARVDGTPVKDSSFPALTWNVVTQTVKPGKTFAWNIYKNDDSQPNPVYGDGFAMCLTRTGHA